MTATVTVRKWDFEKDGTPKMYIDSNGWRGRYISMSTDGNFPLYEIIGRVESNDVNDHEFESYILSTIEKVAIVKKYNQIVHSWYDKCQGECPYTFSTILNDHIKLKYIDCPPTLFQKLKTWWRKL